MKRFAGCEHFAKYVKDSSIKDIHSKLVKKLDKGLGERIQCKDQNLCNCEKYGFNSIICLDCDYHFCSKKAKEHLKLNKHGFGIESNLQEIFCFECDDYIFHRLSFTSYFPLYVRGLLNLGNTCFMNVVLQSLVHNPILSSYFLAENHNRNICSKYAVIKSHGNKRSPENVCLACETDHLFKEMYSGLANPFIPMEFLYSVWNAASHMAGYEQQDAHEFLHTLLDGLCNALTKDSIKSNEKCNCIIHTCFSGSLRSNLVCFNCSSISTVTDLFMDISLDMPTSAPLSGISLIDLLHRYTEKELLGTNEAISCIKCGISSRAYKQLSIESLPNVLCLTLKRFEHSRAGFPFDSSKIESHVKFPLVLDMSSFLSTNILSNYRNTTRKQEYRLISVLINHGNLTNGHYKAYVRRMNRWFLCDDSSVTAASIDDVLSSEAYILFYIKSEFGYED